MALPAGDPTTIADVKAWASITDERDDAVLAQVFAAVNVLVRGLPVAQRLDADPALGAWPGDIKLGATMLAARMHRRRNTAGGVEAAGAFGVAYVRRNDPDVAQLLQLGEYATPLVG